LKTKKVIVIGGGAAGFFAAINCAQKNINYEVILIEKTRKLLSKVRISGGGRCNVTHACFDNKELVKRYPRGSKELQSVFNRFTTNDTVSWFENRDVKLKTENDGRMFPESNTSESIVNCLMQEAEFSGVKILLNTDTQEIIQNKNGFTLKIKDQNNIDCDAIIITTGGNPKEGAYKWLANLGHKVIKPVPSLFTFKVPNNNITKLMGVAVADAKVKIAKTKLETTSPLLITHWGFSGPAVLKTSAWGARVLSDLNYEFTILINWVPSINEEGIKEIIADLKFNHPKKTILKNVLLNLPKRLWEHFVLHSNIKEETRWGDLSKKQLNSLINKLQSNEYQVRGKTTFKEEFVTCGGISLKDIDLKTMESKRIPNIYFAGEVIDIDGITGGFNFQNAWSTAYIASQNV
jgi:hypothetical protein